MIGTGIATGIATVIATVTLRCTTTPGVPSQPPRTPPLPLSSCPGLPREMRVVFFCCVPFWVIFGCSHFFLDYFLFLSRDFSCFYFRLFTCFCFPPVFHVSLRSSCCCATRFHSARFSHLCPGPPPPPPCLFLFFLSCLPFFRERRPCLPPRC